MSLMIYLSHSLIYIIKNHNYHSIHILFPFFLHYWNWPLKILLILSKSSLWLSSRCLPSNSFFLTKHQTHTTTPETSSFVWNLLAEYHVYVPFLDSWLKTHQLLVSTNREREDLPAETLFVGWVWRTGETIDTILINNWSHQLMAIKPICL